MQSARARKYGSRESESLDPSIVPHPLFTRGSRGAFAGSVEIELDSLLELFLLNFLLLGFIRFLQRGDEMKEDLLMFSGGESANDVDEIVGTVGLPKSDFVAFSNTMPLTMMS